MIPCRSIDEILRLRAEQHGERRAYGSWADGGVGAWLSYADLDRRARAIGAALQEMGAAGERALLLFPPGLDYISAFFGCLYGGAIAVPAYPPDPARLDRTLPRLQAIVRDAQASLVLTTSAIAGFQSLVGTHAPALAAVRWLATDICDGVFRERRASGDDIAFLQYTSGSTSDPKGVMVTHANLLHNCAALHGGIVSTEETLQVSWLPPYHDMGLIAGILLASFVGFPLVTLSPFDFLLRPRRWLEAISATRAHISGTPNFALDLCVQKVQPADRAGLDLSCLKFVYVSAEPVRRASLDRFAEAFAPCGFDPKALFPTYGLAEATLVATGGTKLSGYRWLDTDEGELVSMGGCVTGGGELAIVDPATHQRLPDGRLGEIWLRGASNARGYWNQPAATDETFGASLPEGGGPWLRTGDLGLQHEGELYIAGRLKEVIIIRGRKHYPTDIEDTVEALNWNHAYYRAGGSAAFALDSGGQERLCVAIEVERRMRERRAAAPSNAQERRRGSDRRARPFRYKAQPGDDHFDADDLVRGIRRAIATTHGVEPWAVLLLRPGAIPKTSSGKKRRLACRELYFSEPPPRDVLHRWYADAMNEVRLG
jgi:acyl-CoA synthetase (AMP-forming)/AMP-acid ligase II